MASPQARVWAGIPAVNLALYHRIRFGPPDPAVLIELRREGGQTQRILIVRDIEVERARRQAVADQVGCPADFAPPEGLSGDRETATAEAAAECLRREGVAQVTAHRSLPMLYVMELERVGLAVTCDPDLGLMDRRSKDDQERAWLLEAQRSTETAMRLACEMVARARPRADGILEWDGQPLTSERVREAVDICLLRQGYQNPTSIVAGGPSGADCHALGQGPLRTSEPVIIDIFPRSCATLYHGDCTRTVVHGEIPAAVGKMHEVVVAAKAAALATLRAGVSGADVHRAATQVVLRAGYAVGLPPADADDAYCGMVHGTGHGIGLEVHEPPLLDEGGPPLVVGDVLTVEPGLYSRAIGGVRVEDMVIVGENGCENLNRLPEGLDWR